MVKFLALSLSLLAVVQVMAGASEYSDTQIEEIVKNSGEGSDIYTTHSETHRPIHVPVYERYPINVPHPEPIAVPQYIRVPIPQPYPKYTHVPHRIEIPVYKIIPEIIEKPVPYTVEKPYPVEIERPFPVEVVKKLEIPVPKPYPVHVVHYKHISEDDPPPKAPKMMYGFTSYPNKYANDEDFQKPFKASQIYGIKTSNLEESLQKYQNNHQIEHENQLNYENDDEEQPKHPKIFNPYNGKVIDVSAKNFKFVKGINTKAQLADKHFLKTMKLFYRNGGKLNNYNKHKLLKLALANSDNENQSSYENFPPSPVIIFNGKSNKNEHTPKQQKFVFANEQNFDEDFPQKSFKLLHGFNSKSSKQKKLKSSGKFSPDSRHEHRFNGY